MNNLIYFTVFGNKDYLNMLKLCLKSIVLSCNNKMSFDFLFITEIDFEKEISFFTKDFNNKSFFLIKNTIKNPMRASMQKLNIFEFEKIENYEKIVFLDCDILVLKNINTIFEEKWNDNLLSVFQGFNISGGFNSKFHGLTGKVPEKKIQDLKLKNIVPFNAGHFAFKNSIKMKNHFENTLWLSKVWPGEYFYEQSFMNHYFALNELVDYSLFRDKIFLASLNENTICYKFLFDNIYIIHFIGASKITADKTQKIKNFFYANFKTV